MLNRYITLLIVSSLPALAWGKNFCDDIFVVESLVQNSTSLSPEEIAQNFPQSLDLEQKSTWLGYLRNPNSLEVINSYLRNKIPPLQKSMTVLKADREVSGATLVRVGQWNRLFQNAKHLPIGTRLYHSRKMSEQRARRLAKAILFFDGEYLVSTRRQHLPSLDQTKTDEWDVVYRMNLQEEIKTVPGRAELEEYILDRNITLRIQGSYFDEVHKVAYLNLDVENNN
jgi:hypothetical protein